MAAAHAGTAIFQESGEAQDTPQSAEVDGEVRSCQREVDGEVRSCRREVDGDARSCRREVDGEAWSGRQEVDGDAQSCRREAVVRAVEAVVRAVMVERLECAVYDAEECSRMSEEVAGRVMEALKALRLRRMKLVCVVSLGSMQNGPAMQFGSRCVWDDHTDAFTSVKFTNSSLFAVALIYCIHF